MCKGPGVEGEEHGTGGKLKAKGQWKAEVIEEEECDVPWGWEGRWIV